MKKPLIYLTITILCFVFAFDIALAQIDTVSLPSQEEKSHKNQSAQGTSENPPQSNQKLYEYLVERYLSRNNPSYRAVEGFRTDGLDSVWNIEPGTSQILVIEPPVVEYEPIKRKKVIRTINIGFGFRDTVSVDSLFQSRSIEWSDTLQMTDLHFVRKTNYVDLKGENPRKLYKFILPVIAIVAGISSVIALFYLRS